MVDVFGVLDVGGVLQPRFVHYLAQVLPEGLHRAGGDTLESLYEDHVGDVLGRLADVVNDLGGQGLVVLTMGPFQHVVADLDDALAALVECEIVELHAQLFAVGHLLVALVVEGIAVGQFVPVLVNRAGFPGVIAVAVGGHVDTRQRVHLHAVVAAGGQVYGELAAAPLDVVAARRVQVDGAVVLLAGEHQRGSDGRRRRPVGGEDVVQDGLRVGHGDGGAGHVQVLVGFALHAQDVGDAPALLVGVHAVSGVVEAVVDLGHGDVALIIFVSIPPGQEGVVQPVGQQDERGVVVEVVIYLWVFVDEGHVHAVVLAHVQAGQCPVVVVGLYHLQLVHCAVLRADAVVVLLADVH